MSEVERMLSSVPRVYNPKKSFKSLEAWKQIRPMSVEEILRFSGDVTLDLHNLEFKEITT